MRFLILFFSGLVGATVAIATNPIQTESVSGQTSLLRVLEPGERVAINGRILTIGQESGSEADRALQCAGAFRSASLAALSLAAVTPSGPEHDRLRDTLYAFDRAADWLYPAPDATILRMCSPARVELLARLTVKWNSDTKAMQAAAVERERAKVAKHVEEILKDAEKYLQ